jgi:DNA-binding protein YbaB
MDTDVWSARLREETTRRLEAVAAMQDELAQVHGEAEAAHGWVRVRVTPAGRPVDLHLDPAATRLPTDQLAGHVLAAVREATDRAARRAREVVGRVLPDDDVDALLGGVVSADDRTAVREQLDAWHAEVDPPAQV